MYRNYGGVLIAVTVAPTAAYAQTGEFKVWAGPVLSREKVTVSSALIGSLAPSTPFRVSDSRSRLGVAPTLGYDLDLGSVFVGVEGGFQYAPNRQTVSASASASARQRVTVCYPQPPGVPGDCSNAITTTTVFNENQTLDLTVRSKISAMMVARLGAKFGRTRVLGFGGLSTKRTAVSYQLPSVSTAVPFTASAIEVRFGQTNPLIAQPTTLVAEQRSEAKWATGWVLGAAIEHGLSDRLLLRVSYAHSDNGAARFAGTARLAPLRVTTHANTLAAALGIRF